MTEQASKAMYSPVQVGAATLLAGPLAGAHLLWSNFQTLDQPRQAKITSIVAVSVFVLLVIFALASSSKNHAGLVIGLILALSARSVADIYQLKKETIAASSEYSFRSNWKVLGISVAWLAISVVLIVAISVVLTIAGVDLPD